MIRVESGERREERRAETSSSVARQTCAVGAHMALMRGRLRECRGAREGLSIIASHASGASGITPRSDETRGGRNPEAVAVREEARGAFFTRGESSRRNVFHPLILFLGNARPIINGLF
jgi:hypothetical protein